MTHHPFWQALSNNALSEARELLEKEPSLASKDFRTEEEQKKDPYDVRFPLVTACQSGHYEMAELLLQHGADIDAVSPTEEQRVLGKPILVAVTHGHYRLAHLLLDRGASLGAHGYCSASMVEELYEAALKAGASEGMVRKGFDRYLGKSETPPLDPEAPEVLKLFDRVLNMGGQPSLNSIVYEHYYELVEELLRTCPEEPGTPHDHPQGTVFVNLCDAASWHGCPKVFTLAMEICPERHGPEEAKRAIRRALVSHNRVGTVQDYEELIETQLKFLQKTDTLESTIKDGSVSPHFLLAKDYLWPKWCGPESSPSTVESMIALSEMFIRYGFTDLSRRDEESGLTAAEQADKRTSPGLDQFAAFLRERLISL